MKYTALEALDKKYGRTVTIADWRAVGEKSAADLTDDDLVIIETFAGAERSAEARKRRTLALNPPAPVPVTEVKAAPMSRWSAFAADAEALPLLELFEKYADLPTPLGAFGDIVNDFANERDQMRAQITSLQQQVEELNAIALKAPTGPWEAGKTYAKHDTVQRSGGLWMCCSDHLAGEEFSHPHWRLIVKAGKDAKDLSR